MKWRKVRYRVCLELGFIFICSILFFVSSYLGFSALENVNTLTTIIGASRTVLGS